MDQKIDSKADRQEKVFIKNVVSQPSQSKCIFFLSFVKSGFSMNFSMNFPEKTLFLASCSFMI